MKRFLAFAVLLLSCLPAAAQDRATAVRCNASVVYNTATLGSLKLINAPTIGGIYICGFIIAPTTVTLGTGAGFVYSTATFPSPTLNLGALTPAITPIFQFTTITNSAIIDSSSAFRGMYVPPGNSVFLATTATSSIQAILYYFTQQP